MNTAGPERRHGPTSRRCSPKRPPAPGPRASCAPGAGGDRDAGWALGRRRQLRVRRRAGDRDAHRVGVPADVARVAEDPRAEAVDAHLPEHPREGEGRGCTHARDFDHMPVAVAAEPLEVDPVASLTGRDRPDEEDPAANARGALAGLKREDVSDAFEQDCFGDSPATSYALGRSLLSTASRGSCSCRRRRSSSPRAS